MNRTFKAAVAGAVLVVLAVAVMGARRPTREPFDYFDSRYKGSGADSVDTAIAYFAKAGSLTANADSSVGYLSYFHVWNFEGAAQTLRVYHPGGEEDAGTDSAYTNIYLQNISPGHDGDEFVMPEGMRIKAIRLMTDPDTNGLLWRAGK